MSTMTVICPHCHALYWMSEQLTRSLDRSPQFGDCCLSGKINLPILQDVPYTLKSLLEDHTSEAVSFRNNIRQYNMALTFTSLGANFDWSLLDGSGPYVLKLYGELYHNHGTLIPNENRDAFYAQLYIYDSQMVLNQRMNRNQSLDRDTMSHLQNMLLEHNPFVPLYKQAAERLREQGAILDVYNQVMDAFTRVDSEIASNANSLGRRYILPSTFQGGSRDMMKNLQNSLAISRRYGIADLFITMTANPKWPEILNALLPGQTPTDRPDLVSRVFHQKKFS